MDVGAGGAQLETLGRHHLTAPAGAASRQRTVWTKTSTTTVSPTDSDFHAAPSIHHFLPLSIVPASTSAT